MIGKIRLDLRLVPTDPSIVGIVLCSLDMMSLSLRRALATSNTNVLNVVTFKIRSSRSSYPGPSVRQAPRRVVNTNEDFVDKTHALSQNLKSSTCDPGIGVRVLVQFSSMTSVYVSCLLSHGPYDHSMHGADIWMDVDMQTSKTLYAVQSPLLNMSKR